MQLPAPLSTARPAVAFPVLNMPKLELCFTDGSLLFLQQINNNPLKRTFTHNGQQVHVDLEALVPLLAAEVYAVRERDQPAVIFFTLRHRFKSAQAFIEAVRNIATCHQQGLAA
jgi:hypothetical protein